MQCHLLELASGSAGKRTEPTDGEPGLWSPVVKRPQDEGSGINKCFGISVSRRMDQPRPDVPDNSLILLNLASLHS